MDTTCGNAVRTQARIEAEVLEAARQQGIEEISKVRLAVLEVSGKISIIEG